jgi:hypothetical protein
MNVTLRKNCGTEVQVPKEAAEAKTFLGYYQFNEKEGVYEYTEYMRSRIKKRVAELRAERQ